MAKSSPALTTFNGGYVSPLFEGRSDLENYPASCRVLENFIPTIQGPIVKRPGTIFVEEVKDSTEAVRLIPFQFNVEQAYIIEMGDLYMRFYTDGARLEVATVPVEVVTPYLETELFEIQFAQTADIMYLVHPNHPPQKLSRTSATAFSLDEVVFEWPAFLDQNTDEAVTFTLGGATYLEGNTPTVTASSPVFDATHVGSFIRFDSVPAGAIDEWAAGVGKAIGDYVYYEGNVYRATTAATTGTRPPVHEAGSEIDGATGVTWAFHNEGAGYVEITGFTSTTVVSTEVIANLPPQLTTFRWSLGAWSDFEGYPRAVAFYENRLLLAGTAKKPQTIWGSVSDSYQDFKSGTEDDESYSYTINTNQVNTIQWLSPSRVLAIGTAGGEFIATGSSFADAITPTNIRITRQTSFGSAHILPVQIGPDILFTQRSKRGVREYRYNFDIEGYVATDLNIFADDALIGNVVQAVYQQEPARNVWYVQEDGALSGLTFERLQAVVGWHTHVFGGADVKVESAAVIPHPDGDVDQLWLLISRTVDGGTVRYVERMEKLFAGEETPKEAVFSDSAVIYSGAATDTITGLDHLEGETVTVLCDGAVVKPDPVVASGSITLASECENAVVGLAYDARYQSMRIDSGGADGTSQGKTGRINNLTMRVKGAGSGIFIGTNFDKMSQISLRKDGDAMDEPVPLVTGDIGPEIMPNGYEKACRIAVKHALPTPFTLVGLYPQLHKMDR